MKTDTIGGDPGDFRTGLELSIDRRNAGGKIETHIHIHRSDSYAVQPRQPKRPFLEASLFAAGGFVSGEPCDVREGGNPRGNVPRNLKCMLCLGFERIGRLSALKVGEPRAFRASGC